jgi:rhodanese-related sulfurtransferase/DNA-directed RNA polymerase subunit RPC12/RpoP
MKGVCLIVVGFIFAITSFAQTKEYVCSPCGGACDRVIHAKPGNCPACGMALVEKSALNFANLSPEEFCERITANKNAVLLDVRTAGEFEGSSLFRSTYGHFKNAININIEELEARVSELTKYKDQEILVYCSHSIRSPRAAIILNKQGFKNVKNLAGGVSTFNVPQSDCLKNNFVVH